MPGVVGWEMQVDKPEAVGLQVRGCRSGAAGGQSGNCRSF